MLISQYFVLATFVIPALADARINVAVTIRVIFVIRGRQKTGRPENIIQRFVCEKECLMLGRTRVCVCVSVGLSVFRLLCFPSFLSNIGISI